MGRDLGIAVLRHGRALLPAAALAAALATSCPVPAYADDPTPAPAPAQAPSATLSPPSQQQIDDARSALDRLRNGATAPAPVLARVSGPTAPSRRPQAPRISDEGWWTIGAAALVLLVLSETTRLSVRRAKHRKA
jgi:hypothetical protein